LPSFQTTIYDNSRFLGSDDVPLCGQFLTLPQIVVILYPRTAWLWKRRQNFSPKRRCVLSQRHSVTS